MAPAQRSQPKHTTTRPDNVRPPISATKITKSTPTSRHRLNTRSLKNDAKTKSKRRPHRPFKMPGQPSSSQSQSAQPSSFSSTPASTPPPRRLCMLETLPVEVIEKIFLYALNPDLPRASLPIAAAVSSERIYRIFILLAFWEDNADHRQDPVGAGIKRILTPVDYDHVGRLSWEMRSKLQAQIFACKWCTMDRILKQVPTMMVLNIHRNWLDAGIKMEPDDRVALERFMRREDDSTLSFHGTGPILFHFAKLTGLPRSEIKRLDPRPFHTYEMRLTPMAMVEIASETTRIMNTFPVLSLCAVPDKLLRGRRTGFTAEDVEFLEMLRITSSNYMHLDARMPPCSDTVINRVILHEGVKNAINTQNFNALISLLKFDEFVFRFREANQGLPVFYTIPSEHFLLVTRVGRQNPSLNHAFFEALLRTSAESLPASSSEIIQWAVDNVNLAQRDKNPYAQINGRFARWLSDFMVRLPDQVDFTKHDPKLQLFTCGSLNLNDVEGCRVYDEVLAPEKREPFGNWMAESVFFRKNVWVERTGPASLSD
ncbi:hypothetical protein N7478_009313 [Penicillium angulare]|uniref:uncharacterized protein n=1 Tax=Penicillium angulare TaxID=116970 RepID=UPI00253FB9F5|nr:uncharacterized protein N7478_009313 [Penicillium angulare]KAJ5266505.1 hypothetical protein N7478_009313 [Penicillium angulare]